MADLSLHRAEKNEWELFSGVTLIFQNHLTQQEICRHKAEKECLEINYCRKGRLAWRMQNGRCIYLGPGDFCIHTRRLCAGSVMTIPEGGYEGLSVCIDLRQFEQSPPKLLDGTGITGRMLTEKFCFHGDFQEEGFSGEDYSVFYGNERTKAVFDGFYDKSEDLKKPYFVLKTLELFLYLGEVRSGRSREAGRYRPEQVETVREVHEYLLRHMERRITIEELSQKYLMNPTTLKAVFKEVYGESLASHMKEHRMERAAALLGESADSIAQIAEAVGYGSQSRFSAAFREVYHMLPLEYRKAHIGRYRQEGIPDHENQE